MTHKRNLFSGKKGRKRSLPFWRRGPGRGHLKREEGGDIPIYDPLKKPDPSQVVNTRIDEEYRVMENRAYTYPPFVVVGGLLIVLALFLYFFF